ncbi:MAG TPA: M14 family zinc carboxypeptidase [Thermoleophilaceae bacterium]
MATLRGYGRIRGVGAAAVGAVWLCALFLAGPAAATPVATNEGAYAALGRVFPDPLAGCQAAGTSPCSPNAQGNVPATQFIGIDEFMDAIRYMNSKGDWQRYMDIVALDGKLGDGAGSTTKDVDPNNNVPLEFKPDAKYVSAGLPTTELGRRKSDLMAIRVTDENVPDKGKKRYALSLSIHGIERAGAEGGIRAMEDLVTAFTKQRADQPIAPKAVQPNAPTFADVLRKSIIYFTLPNPDGWRRGSVSSGGVFFQRYNGNGVDPNRDWPDIGFSYRGYSAISEPETQAWIDFYTQVNGKSDPRFAAGDDLHGQPFADALSYTLLPHGRHSYAKNLRIQDAAIAIHNGTYDAIKWSPIVVPDDSPRGGATETCEDTTLGTACGQIYAQTWGTVYDTINYTTTGALGDWYDSSVGLNADGIDNEMSFSHLDKNINFDPHTEQLHVDGNKALIYAHLTRILSPPPAAVFDADGRKAYVPNKRLRRDEKSNQPGPPAGSVAQFTYDSGIDPTPGGGEFPFTVRQGQQPAGSGDDAGKNIFNGGMRIEVTDSNVQGVGSGQVTLQVQCKNCDEHPGVKDADGFVTVAEDYNQSFLYAQSGIVATVNRPQAFGRDGKPVEWRAVIDGPTAAARVQVHFTQGPASASGETGGGIPPVLRKYDVANTDFFKDLNEFMPGTDEDMRAIDPAKVIAGTQSLSGLDTIALADDALPGYTGDYGGVVSHPTGGPTPNQTFASAASAPGGGQGAPRNPPAGTYEDREFTIGPNDSNKSAKIQMTWTNTAMDWDMYVFRKTASGGLASEGSSAQGAPQTSETVIIPDPSPGTYVVRMINFAAPDPTFTLKVEFTAPPPAGQAPPSDFTGEQKDKWLDALRKFVEGGGNLVLTDGALRALPDLVPGGKIPGSKVQRQRVYVGQSAFAFNPNGPSTAKDVLLRDTQPPGARNNTGFRRQMFEPTPLGFAIQTEDGGDASFARQYAVDKETWEKAGGRSVAASADAGARDAGPIFDQVTIGELKLGSGQIRIAGALLPQPSEEYDHEWGIEPYAVTYTGYTVARNLLDQPNRGAGGGVGTIGGRFLISGRAVKMSRKGDAGVRVSCRTPLQCNGKLTLYVKRAVRVKGKRRVRAVKIGAAKFNIRTKTRNTVLRVRLTKSGRKIIRERRRTRVIAKAPVKFRDGLTGTARKTFRLYRPSRRR